MTRYLQSLAFHLGVLTSAQCPVSEPKRPLVIAHRGGSIQYPESSVAAYTEALAHADLLECDLTITKDGILLCQHEPDLTRSSNAKEEQFRSLLPESELRKEWLDPVLDFEVQSRKKNGDLWHTFLREDARPSEGWYTPDYNYNDTISKLSAPCAAHQRCDKKRVQPIATLDDLWALAQRRRDGSLGLYIEVKHNTWHQTRRGRDILVILLTYLSKRSSSSDVLSFPFPVHIQSFEIGDLIRLRHFLGYDAHNVYLVGLATVLHTTYNLPPACCSEDLRLRRRLQKAWEEDESGMFVRLPGTFGEMFVGVVAPETYMHQADDSTVPVSDRDEKCIGPSLANFNSNFPTLKSTTKSCQHCKQTVAGLKILPLTLRAAQQIRATEDDKARRCQAHIDDFAHQLHLSCASPANPGRFFAYEPSTPRSTQAIDVSCLVDSLGLDLRYVEKYPSIVAEAHERCVKVHVWTVKTEADMELALGLGVDGIITDHAAMSMKRVEQI